MRRPGARWLLGPVAVLAACSSDPVCTASRSPDCADIVFQQRSYDEWRTIDPPRVLQEIGDANYPSCTHRCSSEESAGVGGFGTTDVWQLGRVAPDEAVIGLREGTHTYVVFVAVGTDPSELVGQFDESRLG